MDSAGFAASVREALSRCRENVAAFVALPDTTPFAERLEAFDRLTGPLNELGGRAGLYIHVHPEAEVREVCEGLVQELSAFGTELSLNRELFDSLNGLDPKDASGPVEKRLLEHALRDFRRSGVDRDEATRERIRALREELVLIGQEFDRNIIMGGKEFVVQDGHAGLEGLPEDFLAAHPEREDGTVLLNTDPPDRIPVLSFAERDDVRSEYYRVSMNRAVPENLDVLPKLLAKRHELATLLGYANWADFVTEEQMTKSGANASDFIARVAKLVRERGEAEIEDLLAIKRKRDPEATGISESERIYLTEKVKRERFDFDARAVRFYFPYEKVKQGVLETSSTLYGLSFAKVESFDSWHPSVECYDVVDGGEVLARFYLDMHPREGKFKHAAMMHVVAGTAGGPLPEAALVCNFPEPSADDPALLLHDQVTTFFHEFGHLLHQLLAGKQRFLAFSGISTEHDFVEVPSQMYEEWAWNLDVLRTFAVHVETGETISSEMVATMRAAEEYGKALHTMQQMYYARLSLTFYDRDPADLDLTREMIDLKRELLLTRHEEGTHFHASFGHLHGYSAIYYTYMWSLVIAKDLFSRFEGDLMNGATANEYRSTVLAPGGSKDAAELVRDFLGREYAYDSFERWLAR